MAGQVTWIYSLLSLNLQIVINQTVLFVCTWLSGQWLYFRNLQRNVHSSSRFSSRI